MRRNSLLPLEYLLLPECCTGLEPLMSPCLSLSLWVCSQIPSRAGSAAAAWAGINGPCTLQRWWQGQINPLLENQCSDGSWWGAESPLSLGCPENGCVAQHKYLCWNWSQYICQAQPVFFLWTVLSSSISKMLFPQVNAFSVPSFCCIWHLQWKWTFLLQHFQASESQKEIMHRDFNLQPQNLYQGACAEMQNAHLCSNHGAMFLCPAGFQPFHSLKMIQDEGN